MKKEALLFESILLAVLFSFIFMPKVYAEEKGVLFYLPFEGSVTEKTKNIAGIGEKYEFVKGKSGQGAYFPNGAFVRYPASGNINYRHGTVAFWVSPHWYGDDGGYHYFFAGNITDARNINSLHVSKKPYQGGVILGQIDGKIAESSVPKGPIFSATSVESWKPHEWHHIAFTWNDQFEDGKKVLKLYIDGLLRATNDSLSEGAIPVNYEKYINVGSSIDHVVYADAVIDELKIWDHAFTDLEIGREAGLRPIEQQIISKEKISSGTTASWYLWVPWAAGGIIILVIVVILLNMRRK